MKYLLLIEVDEQACVKPVAPGSGLAGVIGALLPQNTTGFVKTVQPPIFTIEAANDEDAGDVAKSVAADRAWTLVPMPVYITGKLEQVARTVKKSRPPVVEAKAAVTAALEED